MKNKKENFMEQLQRSPVIASIKDESGLKKVLESDCLVVFILYGSILNIDSIVKRVKDSGRMAFIHIDLIDGFSPKDVCIDYIAEHTEADGILSTRTNIVRHARETGLIAIQRFFLLDSISLNNILRQPLKADLIDVMPGVMPGVIRYLAKKTHRPIMASGLISTKKDIISALSAGALAISTTREDLWDS